MTPVQRAPVTATLQMTPATWGTKVSLDCRGSAPLTGAVTRVKKTYLLVAVPRNGGAEETLAQWAVHPGEDAKVAGSTDLATEESRRSSCRAVADDAVLLQALGDSSSYAAGPSWSSSPRDCPAPSSRDVQRTVYAGLRVASGLEIMKRPQGQRGR